MQCKRKKILNMSKTNNIVFWALYAIAWIIFIGLSIEAGALVVNFLFSLYKPEIVQNLYQKLDLIQMYNENKFAFFSIYSFILIISILKAVLFYTVISLMHTMDRTKPFSTFVAKQISYISYFTLSIGLLSFIGREVTKNLMHEGLALNKVNQFWVDSEAYIFMWAVIHIIATIFKKGVAIQNENDLTV